MQKIDFTKASVVYCGELSRIEQKAAEVLVDEVEKRTGIKLPVSNQYGGPCIFLVPANAGADNLPKGAEEFRDLKIPGRDGYRLLVKENMAVIKGADPRGLLYGVGKFLRKMYWAKGKILVEEISSSSTPEQKIRGHQLGYRPKTNAYDAWTKEQYDQYIRELALFGANSIEILPPRTDDDYRNELMKVEPLEMLRYLSDVIHGYGLDVWIWYPNMGLDYTDPEVLREEIKEREEVFSKTPYIDHVFIPGGDPGDLEPVSLFRWSEKTAEILHQYHPDAQVWLSPQAFEPSCEWVEAFYNEVDKRPQWLGGIVFGPWERDPLPKLRDRIPAEYPIRNYPDITHSRSCQYPIYDWDKAFTLTLGRECINPRPTAEKHFHNLLKEYSIGSLSYSEGINDDVNKFVWSDQDWDSSTEVLETLREFARLFIGPEYSEGVAQGLMNLERNFEGPLISNPYVEQSLIQWKTMERNASEAVLKNFRFQQGLLRAYYDAYIRRRLIHETELERQAMEILEDAVELDSLQAVRKAKAILQKTLSEPIERTIRKRCDELADDLFESIGAQLTTQRHKAKSWGRGAFMDSIDVPLNNYSYLTAYLSKCEEKNDDGLRMKLINALVNRNNPGPGGFYDNYGEPFTFRRLDPGPGFEKDPGFFESPIIGNLPQLVHGNKFWFATQKISSVFDFDASDSEKILELHAAPSSFYSNALSYYGTPIRIRYTGLNPQNDYIFKIIGFWNNNIAFTANGHPMSESDCLKEGIYKTYTIPGEWAADGKLELLWTGKGSGYVIIFESWLMIQ